MAETSVKGKLGENMIIGEFLKGGFDVYLPVVDRGVDCVIKGAEGSFYEIQIKTRATEKRGGTYFYIRNFEPRDNYFVVCYMAWKDETYILPSKVFAEHSKDAYSRRGTRVRLVLNEKKQRLLSEYKDNYRQFR